MRLSAIHETLMSQKLRELVNSGDMDTGGPITPTTQPNGVDAGSRTAGFTSQPTGIPVNQRHQSYFGMPIKPENINI